MAIGGGPWGAWPLEGAPATGHWVCYAWVSLSSCHWIDKDQAAGGPDNVWTTHLVKRLGDSPRDAPDPPLSFPIYKTGLMSPLHGLHGDP